MLSNWQRRNVANDAAAKGGAKTTTMVQDDVPSWAERRGAATTDNRLVTEEHEASWLHLDFAVAAVNHKNYNQYVAGVQYS
jgi:hypothetical protein